MDLADVCASPLRVAAAQCHAVGFLGIAGTEGAGDRHPENFWDRWQLYVLEARLVQGDPRWPRRYRRRSARRAVMAFDRVLDALFGRE